MKKMNKFIALVLSLVMTMSFTVIGNADVSAEKFLTATEQDTPIGVDGFDLNPESTGVGETLSTAQATYTQTFTYTPKIDYSLNLQAYKGSQYDSHRNDNSTYTFMVKVGAGDPSTVGEEALKNFAVTGGTKYSFIVTRIYPTAVKEVYVGVTAKLNAEPITSNSFTSSFEGNTNISKYYMFTPQHDGGYLFKVTPKTGCTGDNKNYVMNIHSKTGSSVSEFASYEKNVSECKLRLFLKGGVDYIIEAEVFGGNGLGYDFLIEEVETGSTSVSISGAESLILENEVACKLHPFANKRAYTWYSFTAPEAGCYEFAVNNKYDATAKGEIVVELRDETFSPVEDENVLYLYENESDMLSKVMTAGETCYIQVAEMYRGSLTDVYNVGVLARKHTHKNEIVIDGSHVAKGCPCGLEVDYSFWIDSVKLKNVTYTGKNVTPKVSIGILEDECKEGMTIQKIPSSAYKVTVTSKNKKDVGAAKAKVKFLGEYKDLGTYTVSFKIIPKGTTLTSVKAGSKSFTAKWKKQASKTTGYELRYSLYEEMYDAKTVAVSSNKTLSKKVSKLKENTNYYVQVRTYKKISGKKYYSSWSEKKQVTTK